MDNNFDLSPEERAILYMELADELLEEAHEVAQRAEDRLDELLKDAAPILS
jgi:hypothetical protein